LQTKLICLVFDPQNSFGTLLKASSASCFWLLSLRDPIDLFDFFFAALVKDYEMAIGHQLSSCGLTQNWIESSGLTGGSSRTTTKWNRTMTTLKMGTAPFFYFYHKSSPLPEKEGAIIM